MQGDLKMINELVKLSNHLDELGLAKEANFLDAVTERLSLKKSAQDASLEDRVAKLEELLEHRLKVMDRRDSRDPLFEDRIARIEARLDARDEHADLRQDRRDERRENL